MEQFDKSASIGANLKRQRHELGLTQEQVAERASIATPHYSNIERDSRGLSVDELCSLAAALGVSLDYVVYGDQDSFYLNNIVALLRNQPESFILFVEKTIRFYLENGLGCLDGKSG